MKEKSVAYKNWLTLNGASSSTIDMYISYYKRFIKECPVDKLDQDNLNAFLLSLKNKYSKSTYNFNIAMIKFFFKFKKIELEFPKLSKTEKKLPEYITEKFLDDKLLPMVESTCKNIIPIKTVITFMFYTGIRVSEIDELKRKDIDLEKKKAKIFVSKTNSERIVFFNEKTRNMLEILFKLVPEKENAFCLSSSSVQNIFQRLSNHFPDVNLHPHLLRHSFSVYFLEKGGDLLTLKELLGHSSINSTMRYAQLNTRQLQDKYNKFIK